MHSTLCHNNIVIFDKTYNASTVIGFQPMFSTFKQVRKQAKNAIKIGAVFTGKERDEETGYGYFGARYMDHELTAMWLSVDPMSDKYPSIYGIALGSITQGEHPSDSTIGASGLIMAILGGAIITPIQAII